jgi:hypothetical protein
MWPEMIDPMLPEPGERPLRERECATRVLFVCSQNRLRSPTAERIFAGREGLEAASAGISPDAQSQ